MRPLVAVLALSIGGCRCDGVRGVAPERLRVQPAQLDFGAVYAGATRTLELTLTNGTRLERGIALAPVAPFSTPPALTLAGGSSAQLRVTFTPTSSGEARATLDVDGTAVALRGEGLAPLMCAAPQPCQSGGFDAAAGACVFASLPDGTDCAQSATCFVEASCRSGECTGVRTTCDDGDPCTLEVCGELGCGHLDALPACPTSSSPASHRHAPPLRVAGSPTCPTVLPAASATARARGSASPAPACSGPPRARSGASRSWRVARAARGSPTGRASPRASAPIHSGSPSSPRASLGSPTPATTPSAP